MTANNYDNIPHEMRAYTQWVTWRSEANGESKPKKVPYSARTGERANVKDPSTWVTFDEVVAAASNFNGIGFVLTDSDPYSFIDLDVVPGELPNDEQKTIYDSFNVSARSSSGCRYKE